MLGRHPRKPARPTTAVAPGQDASVGSDSDSDDEGWVHSVGYYSVDGTGDADCEIDKGPKITQEEKRLFNLTEE